MRQALVRWNKPYGENVHETPQEISSLSQAVNRIDRTEANREQIKLSEDDVKFLRMLYDLKTKRRMSRVLMRDIVRNAQRVKLSDDEESLKAQLRTLVACKFVQWIGHYIITNAGISAVF